MVSKTVPSESRPHQNAALTTYHLFTRAGFHIRSAHSVWLPPSPSFFAFLSLPVFLSRSSPSLPPRRFLCACSPLSAAGGPCLLSRPMSSSFLASCLAGPCHTVCAQRQCVNPTTVRAGVLVGGPGQGPSTGPAVLRLVSPFARRGGGRGLANEAPGLPPP